MYQQLERSNFYHQSIGDSIDVISKEEENVVSVKITGEMSRKEIMTRVLKADGELPSPSKDTQRSKLCNII